MGSDRRQLWLWVGLISAAWPVGCDESEDSTTGTGGSGAGTTSSTTTSSATGGAAGGPALTLEIPWPSTDLTGDDNADLLVANEAGTLLVFAGGTDFAPSGPTDATSRVLAGTGCVFSKPWLIVDVNDDGSSDLLAGVSCGDERSVAVVAGPLSPGDHQLDTFPTRLALELDGALPSSLALTDMDGDLKVDLVASYPDATHNGVATGVVSVFSDLAALIADGSGVPYATIAGEAEGDLFGTIDGLSADVDGDGVHDLLIGARQYGDNGQGRAYLFRGPLESGTTEAASAAMIIDGNNGNANMGRGIAMGDFDGDGLPDLLVGATGDHAAGTATGRVGIFRGPLVPPPTHMNDAQRFVHGIHDDRMGAAIAIRGDLNGDGSADLLAWGSGATVSYTDGMPVGVLVGVMGSPAFAGASTASADFHIHGDATPLRFGDPRMPGDLNADGFDDIAVGLPGHDADRGRVYVIFGASEIASGFASTAAGSLIDGTLGSSDRLGAYVIGR